MIGRYWGGGGSIGDRAVWGFHCRLTKDRGKGTHFVTFDDVWILRVQVLLHNIRETVLYELAQRRQLAVLCHGLEELLKGGGVRGGERG